MGFSGHEYIGFFTGVCNYTDKSIMSVSSELEEKRRPQTMKGSKVADFQWIQIAAIAGFCPDVIEVSNCEAEYCIVFN